VATVNARKQRCDNFLLMLFLF